MLKSVFKKVVSTLKNHAKAQYASNLNDLQNMDITNKFTQVYKKNLFRGQKSKSGEGSDLIQTEIIRREIPRIIKKYKVKSMVDAPCGDWYWMSHVELGDTQYIGVDIVQPLINKNNKEFSSKTVSFKQVNLVEGPVPSTDLVFSRDCLVHLSFEDAMSVLRNIKKSGARYLLTTTFTNRSENVDLGSGFWRTLNMELAPFHFPSPIELINEGCTECNGDFSDKSLGLWKLDDLPLNE